MGSHAPQVIKPTTIKINSKNPTTRKPIPPDNGDAEAKGPNSSRKQRMKLIGMKRADRIRNCCQKGRVKKGCRNSNNYITST